MPGVKAVTIQLNAFAIQVTPEIHSMHALLVSYLLFSNQDLFLFTTWFFSLLVGSPLVPGVAVGCDADDDCPDYTSCRNRRCINPCAVDKPCAPTANCRVVNHNSVCTCPNGYIGTPQTKCTLCELIVEYQYDYFRHHLLMQLFFSSSSTTRMHKE